MHKYKIIAGVPRVAQRGPGWCGYATLSMVLRFWGYNYTQQDLLEHIHFLTEDKLKTTTDICHEGRLPIAPYVTMGELALAAMRLTNLNVSIACNRAYEKILARKPNFTPVDLLKDCIVKGWPCIIHHIDHFYVVVGFSDLYKRFFLKDARKMGIVVFNKMQFLNMWGRPYKVVSPGENDPRYALLVMRPK